jgi:predicted amidohydrolase
MDIHVKHCAQARAIENECYVAIAGCVEFTKVNNMDIQYQAAVYTPLILRFLVTESKLKQHQIPK